MTLGGSQCRRRVTSPFLCDRSSLSAFPWGAAISDKHPHGLQLAAASMNEARAAEIDASASLTATFASVLVSGVR